MRSRVSLAMCPLSLHFAEKSRIWRATPMIIPGQITPTSPKKLGWKRQRKLTSRTSLMPKQNHYTQQTNMVFKKREWRKTYILTTDWNAHNQKMKVWLTWDLTPSCIYVLPSLRVEASDWRVPDTRPDPIIFGNTRSIPDFLAVQPTAQ